MIVTDAGVLVAVFVDDGIWGDTARARLRGEELAAPELVDLEVTAALHGLLRVGKVDAGHAREALTDLRDLSLRRASHLQLLTRCWDLRDNLTAHDASYVALAEPLGTTLVTTDARLSRGRTSCVRLKCCHEPTKSAMSYGRLDITPSSAMLEVWPRELCSRCAGVMKDFAL